MAGFTKLLKDCLWVWVEILRPSVAQLREEDGDADAYERPPTFEQTFRLLEGQ